MRAPIAGPFSLLGKLPDLRVGPGEALLLYLDRIFETERRGDAREESFYPHLLDLFEWYGEERSRDLGVTLIPRQTRECLLDLQVRRGERIAGYVEAKRPAANLDPVAESEQVRRYRRTFPNLILTNFREFRLYRQGELVRRAHASALGDGPERLLELLDLFVDFETPPSVSTADLAARLALRTRLLAEGIAELLESGAPEAADLAGYFEAFSDYLLAGLTQREFADLYAQTLTYGLLAARWQCEGDFDRHTAAESIPASSGLLREVFLNISLDDPPAAIAWIVDEIVAVLAAAPVRSLLKRLERARQRRGDPVLDFYQTFLRCYDPGLRRRRGVYYTPPELVAYVVRSVQRLLVTRLGRRDGLADPGLTLLDPAAGTLTFVVEAVRCAVEAVRREVGSGGVPALLRDHVLRDFHAFELMMAPYAVGHLKMSLVLEEMGHPLGRDERFPLYLTNALEDVEDLKQSRLPFVAALTQEAREAGRVKRESRITVVMGNPPWSGHSENRGRDRKIDALPRQAYVAADGRKIEGYYQVEGEPLGERNPKWLQDDYVKFLRFAQWKIDQAGEGIVAFVTSHSFLDNPTFRGLRRSLLETFDEIYLLDLHGSRKKKERTPDGSADANVFEEVRQGVAVALLVKRPGLEKRVFRADLWGSRGEKLLWLAEGDVESTPWREISPRGPAFLFAPRDAVLEEEYRRGILLTDLFPERSVGIVTGRDAFAVDTDPAALRRRIEALRGWRAPAGAPEDTTTWKLAEAMAAVRSDERWQERFRRILFRPFDWRTIFYADAVIERPRRHVMRHMLDGPNLGLIVPRQCKEEFGALATDALVAHKAVSAYDINTLFPLWLYPEGRLVSEGPVANLAPESLRLFTERLGEEPPPELVFEYVYAVLYSPPFRRRYAGLLRTDFPRVPLPRDRGAFLELSALGAILVDLHLLRSDRLRQPAVHFEGGKGRECLQGIGPEVWEYRVGGYQVLDRWLAARAERPLRIEEIEDLRRIAAALRETIGIEKRIAAVWRDSHDSSSTA